MRTDRDTVLLNTDCDSGPLVRMRLDKLRTQLARQQLHIVSAADKAVLDACRDAEITPVNRVLKGRSEWAIIKAELARRETKP